MPRARVLEACTNVPSKPPFNREPWRAILKRHSRFGRCCPLCVKQRSIFQDTAGDVSRSHDIQVTSLPYVNMLLSYSGSAICGFDLALHWKEVSK
ncbi:hypothetical protein M8818_002403 [Zalaria obscura]|uniref:Uncharacterized protein n=1 Tax=Zalaria obscura TaxID=2024903 RepID=A0ACC3SI30_9PEZI